MIFKICIISIILKSIIVSGTPSHSYIEYIGKFPYHVSVRDVSGNHICGGAIVKANLILASGSCLTNTVAHHIVAGSVDPTDTNPKFTQSIKIVRTERNIGAFGERYMNLYFLENTLKYDSGVQQIQISKNDPIEITTARISGFVTLNNEKRLRSVDQKIAYYDHCKYLLNHPRYNDKVVCTIGSNVSEICRAYEETSLLACKSGETIELCGFPFYHKNFECNKPSSDIFINRKVYSNPEIYVAGFIKIAAFQDWLSSFGIF